MHIRMLGEKPYSFTFVCFIWASKKLYLSYPLLPFYSSPLQRSVPTKWNYRILLKWIIHLLATSAPVGVSSSWLKSRVPFWLSLRASLRSASCGQYNKTCRGVSSPSLQLHYLNLYPSTLTLFRKCQSPILPILSYISIELSTLWRPL